MHLLRTLAHGPSKYNTEALAWELTKLARSGVVVSCQLPVENIPHLSQDYLQQQRQALSSRAFEAEVLNQPAPDAPRTALLRELQQERRPLYDERTGLHAQLEQVDSDAERLALAGRILGLSKRINQHWDTVRYVEQHGRRPEPAAPVAEFDLGKLTLAQLVSKRNNLRSQVSKLKNKPLRADDLATAERLLAQVQVEYILRAE